MIIFCINKKLGITKNSQYRVIFEHINSYTIINDERNLFSYYKSDFITGVEARNKRINQIYLINDKICAYFCHLLN